MNCWEECRWKGLPSCSPPPSLRTVEKNSITRPAAGQSHQISRASPSSRSRRCRAQARRTRGPATSLPDVTSRAYWATASTEEFFGGVFCFFVFEGIANVDATAGGRIEAEFRSEGAPLGNARGCHGFQATP